VGTLNESSAVRLKNTYAQLRTTYPASNNTDASSFELAYKSTAMKRNPLAGCVANLRRRPPSRRRFFFHRVVL